MATPKKKDPADGTPATGKKPASKKPAASPKKSPDTKTKAAGQAAHEGSLDPVELALLQKVQPDHIYLPQKVKRSLVTMEEVTTILQDIPITDQIEETISRKNKKTVPKVSVSDELLESGIVNRHLSELHRAVIDAVLSQLAAGNQVFTAAMLYRTMTGKEAGNTIHKDRQEMVDEAMTQLMYSPLHIDLTLYGKDGTIGGEGVLDGPVLPAERIKVNIHGQSCTAYQITNMPILYRLCVASKGLTVTPLQILSVGMNYTNRNLAILNVLHRKIAPLIYPVSGEYSKPEPLVIPYTTIYEAAMEISENSVTAVRGKQPSNQAIFKKRVRTVVETILNTWVEGKFLKKWEDLREGREFVACKLYFPDKPPRMPTQYAKLPGQGNINPKKAVE